MRRLLTRLLLREPEAPKLDWPVGHPVDMEWDAVLREVIERGEEPKILSQYCAEIGGFTVWIENWPFVYGRPYVKGDLGDWKYIPVLPSRETQFRLHEAISAKQTAAQKADLRAFIRSARQGRL